MSMDIFQSISFNKGVKNLFRVLHDPEIYKIQFTYPYHGQFYHSSGWNWRKGMPEVFWLYGAHKVPMNESWQRTSFEINPNQNPKQWRVCWGAGTAWANQLGNGFDTRSFFTRLVSFMSAYSHSDEALLAAIPEAFAAAVYVPVKDYINGLDLKGDAPLLTKDKVRLAGGHTFEGDISGDQVIVKTFDANYDSPQTKWMHDNPSKTIYDFVEAHKHQLMHAVSIVETAQKTPRIIPFTQNNGNRCLIPLLSRQQVTFPLGAVEKVTEWKDPYTIYHY